MKKLIFILTLFLPLASMGQDQSPVQQDTINHHFSETWHTFGLRAGAGLQHDLYVEMGPSLIFFEMDSHEGFGNAALYSTFEWVPSSDIYGAKIGGELGQNLFMGGLDLKYQTGNKKQDFVITPKIGLGVGFVNFYYGYHLSTNKYPFSELEKHQFSVAFNLTKKYF